MFQQRQLNEILTVEISQATLAPGAVGAGAVVSVTANPTLAGGPSLATMLPGDVIEVYAPPAAATNGLDITAGVVSQGVVRVNFHNGTAGSITPVSAVYTLWAKRITPNIVS
jgi:hypothetical protein